MIEIEKRSLLNKSEYDRLLGFFKENAKLRKNFKRYTIIQIEREDYVPDEEALVDYRIRTDGKKGLLTAKTGSWHSGEARNEYEIHFELDEIKDALGILLTKGMPFFVSVYIERFEYEYLDYVVSIDKYFFNDDYILDFEKLVDDKDVDKVPQEEKKILGLMAKLGIKPIKSEEMIAFIRKLNFIKEAQHDFRKTSLDEWYEEWKEYIYCRV
jgi:CYTH domain-containing protein